MMPCCATALSTSARYTYSAKDFLDRSERGDGLENVPLRRQRLDQRLRLRDHAADDRLDDLRELRRMRGCQKNPRTVPPLLALLPLPRYEPHVRDRAVRIEQITALGVHLLNRRAHFIVVVTAAGDVVTNRVEVAPVQPHQPIEIARVADVH